MAEPDDPCATIWRTGNHDLVSAQLSARVSACICLLSLSACDHPASPSKSVRVASIRYERAYAPVTTSSANMWIQMSIPVAGEVSGRSNIPICFPVQGDDGSFVCDSLNWDLPVDDDCWINVRDPLLNRNVATRVFVNGQRVTRVRSTGVEEIGDFRVDARGRIY